MPAINSGDSTLVDSPSQPLWYSQNKDVLVPTVALAISAFILFREIFSKANKAIEQQGTSDRARERAGWILKALEAKQLMPVHVSELISEHGIGFAFESRGHHAEIEILENSETYISLFDLEGPITVEASSVLDPDDAAPAVGRIFEYLKT